MANFVRFSTQLKNEKVSSLFPENRPSIVSINSTQKISDLFQVLQEHKVLSVPVLDRSLAKPRYTGFVDVIDLVVYVTLHFPEAKPTEIPSLLGTHMVSQIIGLSNRNPFQPVEASAPLMVALELMVKWRVHRIPVVDAEGHLETLITQSHVVKYINDHIYLLKRMKNTSIDELRLGTPEVITIPTTASVIEGFRLIAEKRVSAIGVVDENGVLVGNLSASDIKTVGFNDGFFSKLHVPVGEFLQAVRGEFYSRGNVITVQGTKDFEEVMAILTHKGIHRVYVVDFEGKPLRIITLTDILTCIFEF